MYSFIHNLNDIIGHRYVISYLKKALDKGNVPNVILFHGNPGLGKTSIAKALAIELNGSKDGLVESVIENNVSTDCIKLFNMSSIGDETEPVINELQSASFSSTGLKVVILDEVHGMTKKAQDAILVTLEYLPSNIYVFMCTTEVTMLRESLKSRCITFNLNNLSFNEIKQVIKRKIKERDLRFSMPEEFVLSLIASWSNNQPRMAINLIESFPTSYTVTQEELSAFVATNNVDIAINIVKYLYGSLSRGIEFIDSLSITNDLLTSLIDVLKVALGYTSPLVTNSNAILIRKMFANTNVDNFLHFTLQVTSSERVSKRVFTSRFIENHISIKEHGLIPSKDDSFMLADARTIGDSVFESKDTGDTTPTEFDRELQNEVSIDALFNLGQIVEGD